MARPIRIEFSGALYHVTSRGDRREDIYEDDIDREVFLDILGQVVDGWNWVCHAYCRPQHSAPENGQKAQSWRRFRR